MEKGQGQSQGIKDIKDCKDCKDCKDESADLSSFF